MSIFGAINSAISGLSAQSTAISIISDNIANTSTVGYKASTASFATLVTTQSSSNAYNSGGVTAYANQRISDSGLIAASSINTHMAIDGNGFFVVSESANPAEGGLAFTRAGEFTTNADRLLVSNTGHFLLGYALDANGVPGNNLEAIDVGAIGGTAEPTTTLDLSLNLPAEAAVADTFEVDAEIFDSLGISHDITMTWQKTAANTWSMTVSNPTDPDGIQTGTAAGGPYTITFNGDGTLATAAPNPTALNITGWTGGAVNSTIELGLGTPGRADGLSQLASQGGAAADSTITIDSIGVNGLAFGAFADVEIGKDGVVFARFENGASRAIYQIPLAVFPNPNGLQNGTVFTQTIASGNFRLDVPGTSGAGTLEASALENSTVDIATEFSRMIVAQQAYSAASTVITTADEMVSTLISSMR